MQITFNDLTYYKDLYDEALEKFLANKTLGTIAQRDDALNRFIKIGRVYYKNNRLSYKDIMQLYIRDKKVFDDTNKPKTK